MIVLEFIGLDDPASPLVTIRQRCIDCGAEITRHEVDVSVVGEQATRIAYPLGIADAEAALAHMEAHA